MPRVFKAPVVLLIPMMMLTASCATMDSSPGDRAPYFDAAFNDHNRAPASMSPPTPSSDASSTIDPTYMRTQGLNN